MKILARRRGFGFGVRPSGGLGPNFLLGRDFLLPKALKAGHQSQSRIRAVAFALSVLLFASSSHAQVPGSPAGVSAALIRLFGETNSFTAKADVRVLDTSQKEVMSMPMDFAVLDNKMRIEADMMQMKSSYMPQGAATELQQRGVAQVISVVRPDKKLTYVIYPNKKAYITVPMSKDDTSGEKGLKQVKTALAKETIEGHPCDKNKTVISSEKGQVLEATTWNANDLNDFPMQIQTNEKENSTILRFKDVQFIKPDSKQFEPPAGYSLYNTQQELMEAGKPK